MCYLKVKTRDLEQILNNFQTLVKQILTSMLEDGNYKFSTNLQATLYKSLKPDEKITASFNKGTGRALHAIFNERDIDANIDFELKALKDWVDHYASKTSNWIVESVDIL